MERIESSSQVDTPPPHSLMTLADDDSPSDDESLGSESSENDMASPRARGMGNIGGGVGHFVGNRSSCIGPSLGRGRGRGTVRGVGSPFSSGVSAGPRRGRGRGRGTTRGFSPPSSSACSRRGRGRRDVRGGARHLAGTPAGVGRGRGRGGASHAPGSSSGSESDDSETLTGLPIVTRDGWVQVNLLLWTSHIP